MKGILKIAFKLLVNDKGKFAALLMGITFAVFLMVMMTSIFSGVLRSASSVVINIGAKIWVMDPAVTTVANSVPMPDYVEDAVRSIDGVKFAVPLYSGSATLRLTNGAYQSVTILGLDDTSLLGRPELLEGNIADIFAENGFEGGQPYQKAVEQPSIPSTLQQRSQRRGARIMASAAMMRVLRVYAEQQNQDPRTSQPNYASCIWNIPVCIQKFFAAPQVAITNLNLQVQANSSGDVFAICVDKIHRLTGITQANVDQAKAAFVEDAERFFIKRGSKGYQVLSQRCSVGGTALQMYELNYGVSDCRLYGVALKPTNGAQKPLIVLCILGKALHAGAAQHHRIFDNIRDIINAPTLTRTD